MAQIRPVSINDKDNIVPLEENIRVIENSSYIRESEILILRDQVYVLEKSLEYLTLEYKEFLEDNDLIDESVDAASVIPHAQVSPFYEPEEFDGTNYVDRNTILVPNPTFMPLSIAMDEGNNILGQFGRKLEWYQNEIKKKYILKKQILKRIEDIESRENNI